MIALAYPLRVGALLFAFGATVLATPSPRVRLSFDQDWRFLRTDDAPWTAAQLDYASTRSSLLAASAFIVDPLGSVPASPPARAGVPVPQTLVSFDDSFWRPLDLPHDWGVEGAFDQNLPGETAKLPWAGTGWYRKRFTPDLSDRGKRLTLEIDGAMSYSLVWINGHWVGGWPYGYTSFQIDLTPYLRFDQENVIAVRLDNLPSSSRWYPGSGLYRHVWLTKTNPVHVSRDGIFVTTPIVKPDEAVVHVQTWIENRTPESLPITVTGELFLLDSEGRRHPTGASIQSLPPRTLDSERQNQSTLTFRVPQPRLWSIEEPQRYLAVTSVRHGPTLLDQVETIFGIRTAEFDAEKGFLLNGKRVPLQGVCLHHDLGALGTAVHRTALRRQLELLREMGCNAIRTAHNPPAPEFLDLCDEMGFVVMNEIFDCWTKGKTRNDYHLLFADWHERDLRSTVRRDRNHPSVILWSIGNEVHDQHDPEGWRVGARLAALVREEDRTRPVTAGSDGIETGHRGLQHVLDVFSYNYKPWEYARFHAAFPAIPILGSETASTISTRGEYFFPLSDDKADPGSRADFQVNSYDLTAEKWANAPQTEWLGLDQGTFPAGEFVWTGFDYLGEPSPYFLDATGPLRFTDPERQAAADEELKRTGRIRVPSRSSYFGIIDLAGFPKDRYYLYQSRWSPERKMAHLLPHWTWPERVGLTTPVHVYTSGDEGELFLNGRSLGRKAKDDRTHRLRWDDVVYEPGELKVVTYRKGEYWAEARQQTAGEVAQIQAIPSTKSWTPGATELVFVEVSLVDKDGVLCPRASTLFKVSVEGGATVAALDNGDPTSHQAFQGTSIRAFNGRALVVLKTYRQNPRAATLRLEADGLPDVVLALEPRLPAE